ncbi:hypothetical protein PanWU01x14_115580 [Parasponia andersonii]|uniref:Uncharacterized protein n=1 Tax=Parasponia andersonii TaxID=3476 RepID=A0A2P5CWZ6_PARAD|nr:hypothetical protein PanWU01x14_115580 [Parasponia andersonii]
MATGAGRSSYGHRSEATPVWLAHGVPPAWPQKRGNAHTANVWAATYMANMRGCSCTATIPVATRVTSKRVSPSQQHRRCA